MTHLKISVVLATLAFAWQANPASAASCLDTHASCTNSCVSKGDLNDPNCMIRCRESYDQCKGSGGVTGSVTSGGTLTRDPGNPTTREPRRPMNLVPAVREKAATPQ